MDPSDVQAKDSECGCIDTNGIVTAESVGLLHRSMERVRVIHFLSSGK